MVPPRRPRSLLGGLLILIVAGPGAVLPATRIAAAADCQELVTDLPVPGGTWVAAGETVEKRWRLRNCGDTVWDGYRAVRAEGAHGPEFAAVPRTAPGETVDLTVPLPAPAAPGCHRATYQLVGPDGPFGSGLSAAVLVTPPGTSPVRRLTGDALDRAVVRPAELGEAWSVFLLADLEASSRERGRGFIATYQNSAGTPTGAFPPRRLATVVVQEMASVALADAEVARPPAPDVVREPVAGLGDGPALRQVTGQSVSFAFRIASAAVSVDLQEPDLAPADLEAQARRLAQLQAARVRAVFPVPRSLPQTGTGEGFSH